MFGSSPEALPEVIRPILQGFQEAVWASRLVDRLHTLQTGMPLARLLAHTLTTGLQNRVLGLRLRDYHSSFRAFPMRAGRLRASACSRRGPAALFRLLRRTLF